MSQPRPLPPARILARGSVDDESQIEVDPHTFFNDLEHPQRSRYASNWITGPFYFFPPTRYFLNNLKSPPRAETLLLPYTIPTRYRSNGERDGQSRIPSLHASENHNEDSIVDKRGECDQGKGKIDKESLNKKIPSAFDILTNEHKRRVEDLKEKLKYIIPENGSAVVLMCWGKSSCCSVLPVRVSGLEDEVTTWRQIKMAWYNRKGNWRKLIPGLEVARVDSVEVRLTI